MSAQVNPVGSRPSGINSSLFLENIKIEGNGLPRFAQNPVLVAPQIQDLESIQTSITVLAKTKDDKPLAGVTVSLQKKLASGQVGTQVFDEKITGSDGKVTFIVNRGIVYVVAAMYSKETLTRTVTAFNGTQTSFTFSPRQVSSYVPQNGSNPNPNLPVRNTVPMDDIKILNPITPDLINDFLRVDKEETEVRFIVKSSVTGGRLVGAMVHLHDTIGQDTHVSQMTDSLGSAEFKVRARVGFDITVTKDNFKPVTRNMVFAAPFDDRMIDMIPANELADKGTTRPSPSTDNKEVSNMPLVPPNNGLPQNKGSDTNNPQTNVGLQTFGNILPLIVLFALSKSKQGGSR